MLARLVQQPAELVHAAHRLVVEREDHVSRLHTGRGGGAAGVLHDQPGAGVELAALLGGKRPHDQAELA